MWKQILQAGKTPRPKPVNRKVKEDRTAIADMEGNKMYQKSKEHVLNTIYDIIELQNGRLIMSDTKHGRVHYEVSMYGYVWEFLYIIKEIGTDGSDVSLRVIGERKDKVKEIRREFALLDSMLEGGSSVDFIPEDEAMMKGNKK